jgi:serine/threonine protein kinase
MLNPLLDSEADFRSTFPIRYYLIDFGTSRLFPPKSRLRDCLVHPFRTDRPQRPPEVVGDRPFDPFAADVYQTARLLYAWFIVSKYY